MKTGNGRAAWNSSGLGHRQYLGSGPVSPPRPPGAADSQIVRDGRMQRLQLQGLTEVLLQYLAGPRPRRDDALRRRELPLVGVQHHRVPAAGEQPHQEAVAPLLDPLHLHVVLQDGPAPPGEILEHPRAPGGVQNAAVRVHHRDEVLGQVELGEPCRGFHWVQHLDWRPVFDAPGDEGLDRRRVLVRHVQSVSVRVHPQPRLRLRLLPQVVGHVHHLHVVVFRVGFADDAALAVGRPLAVQEGELFEQGHLVALLRQRVGRAAAHDPAADHQTVVRLGAELPPGEACQEDGRRGARSRPRGRHPGPPAAHRHRAPEGRSAAGQPGLPPLNPPAPPPPAPARPCPEPRRPSPPAGSGGGARRGGA